MDMDETIILNIEDLYLYRLNKYISDNNNNFSSFYCSQADFSIPEEERHIIIEYILLQKFGFYIVPICRSEKCNLVFDIDWMDSFEELLNPTDFYKFVIDAIEKTMDDTFVEPDMRKVVCSHEKQKYKYHISFPFVIINENIGMLLINKIHKYCLENGPFEEIVVLTIFDSTVYSNGRGLAYPYQEKEKGKGMYKINWSKSGEWIGGVSDVIKLMDMSVRLCVCDDVPLVEMQ